LIILKSHDEIERMAVAGRIVAEVLEKIRNIVAPDVTTLELDKFAESYIKSKGASPAFKGYRGFPASICTSVNEQVVHGIPSSERLREGDIVSLDTGVYCNGFYGDAALTLAVGEVSKNTKQLLSVTEKSLYLGIEKAVAGNRLFDISSAIQNQAESEGFSVVRSFVGHGIGRELHEDPQIPNLGRQGEGPMLKEGMTLAIEPMVNAGTWDVEILDDGWTAVTKDKSLSAHFEHTVVITSNGPVILTKI
jgi:methionyl aminopeptidase